MENIPEFDFEKTYRFWKSSTGQFIFKIRGVDGKDYGESCIYLIPLNPDGSDMLVDGKEYMYGITIKDN